MQDYCNCIMQADPAAAVDTNSCTACRCPCRLDMQHEPQVPGQSSAVVAVLWSCWTTSTCLAWWVMGGSRGGQQHVMQATMLLRV